jgi:hypothetical protein
VRSGRAVAPDSDHDRGDGAKLGGVVKDVPTNDVVGRDDHVRRADQEARNERQSITSPIREAAAAGSRTDALGAVAIGQ